MNSLKGMLEWRLKIRLECEMGCCKDPEILEAIDNSLEYWLMRGRIAEHLTSEELLLSNSLSEEELDDLLYLDLIFHNQKIIHTI